MIKCLLNLNCYIRSCISSSGEVEFFCGIFKRATKTAYIIIIKKFSQEKEIKQTNERCGQLQTDDMYNKNLNKWGIGSWQSLFAFYNLTSRHFTFNKIQCNTF